MSIAYASEQLEKKFPSDGSLIFARQGEALFRENWMDESIKLLMEGVRTHPKYVTGFLVLGRIYKEMGRLVEAQHALQEALRLDALCPSALKLLAEICEGLQSYGESARHLEKLASLEPWDGELQSAYRRFLDRSGGPAPVAAPAEPQATGEFAGTVAEFLPKDEASMDTVFGFGSETQFTASRPEPKPMDVLQEDAAARQEPGDTIFMSPGEAAVGATDTAFVPSAPVEGADIEKRLDDLFSLESAAGDETRPGSETATVEVPPAPEGSASVSSQTPITGEDVEKQLDDLFFPGEATETHAQAKLPAADALPPEPRARPQPEFAGLDDRTIALPAFRAPKPPPVTEPEETNIPPESKPAEETVVAAAELQEALETGVVEAVAPDAVVGDDIGQRLDHLFGDENAGATAYADAAIDEPGTSETATFAAGAAATLAVNRKEDDSKVSGDDIEARISQIFEVRDRAPEQPAAPPEDVSGATQTLGLSRDMVFGGEKSPPMAPAASEQRPSREEEPQLRMEEEVAEALSDAEAAATTPPNVATVTLAEIYFQQGLKEQALQIYRQLLEREPENETARKRIQEIETAKSEGEAREEEPDRRAPRPGVKVPRRKK